MPALSFSVPTSCQSLTYKFLQADTKLLVGSLLPAVTSLSTKMTTLRPSLKLAVLNRVYALFGGLRPTLRFAGYTERDELGLVLFTSHFIVSPLVRKCSHSHVGLPISYCYVGLQAAGCIDKGARCWGVYRHFGPKTLRTFQTSDLGHFGMSEVSRNFSSTDDEVSFGHISKMFIYFIRSSRINTKFTSTIFVPKIHFYNFCTKHQKTLLMSTISWYRVCLHYSVVYYD